MPPKLSKEDTIISEDEQWRLVNESGLLETVASAEKPDRADEIFDAILLIIPFTSLLLISDILIHRQYAQEYTFQHGLDRLIPGAPVLSFFIFYTMRYKQNIWMQRVLFVLSTILGPRIIYLVNKSSWLVNIQQCPPLATVWVYTIVQLELGASVLSLATVAAWTWWKEMKVLK